MWIAYQMKHWLNAVNTSRSELILCVCVLFKNCLGNLESKICSKVI